MPLPTPALDTRRYQDLLDEALARIPVHTPEWTNFNKGDPGVTLVELFAFLTENLLYRANQIPDRNRRKFLSLLGMPLQPATPAAGLVTLTNERGPLEPVRLDADLELRAGAVPFHTQRGVDVLPIEAQVFYKRRPAAPPSQQTADYYAQLYASYGTTGPDAANLALYETTPLPAPGITGVDLGNDTVDRCLWIAILARETDRPADTSAAAREALHEHIRGLLAGHTLSIGFVPWLEVPGGHVTPGGPAQPSTRPLLQFWLPAVPPDGQLPADPDLRVATYHQVVPAAADDVLTEPGVVDLPLPGPADLRTWTNLAPLESGVGNFPPALDDSSAESRVLTWLCLNVPTGTNARFIWAGINVSPVLQRAHVVDEQPPNATGEPDQTIQLSRGPVIAGSVRVTVTPPGRPAEAWTAVDDLLTAGPEVPVPDLRLPPGTSPPPSGPARVFAVDVEAGAVRFGDGARGARPPAGATLRVTYDYGVGGAGNVPSGALSLGPALPSGLKVSNPVRTWGGADAESVATAEREVPRFLQHRDRLVTAEDFASIAWRTPGVALGRVEVLAAFNPTLSPAVPGDAPGAVTVMVIPASDPAQPLAPLPDQPFLDAVCDYLDERRLITTELFVRPPKYVDIWISVGIDVVPGASVVDVCAAVKQSLLADLSPLAWPLTRTVVGRELMAVAGRTPGVRLVRGEVLVGLQTGPPHDVPMSGLELPRIAGISVSAGDPMDLDQLRLSGTSIATGGLTPGSGGPGGAGGAAGQGGAGSGSGGGVLLPVPTIPAECR